MSKSSAFVTPPPYLCPYARRPPPPKRAPASQSAGCTRNPKISGPRDHPAGEKPAQRDEVEQRVQPVTSHLGQELRGLGGGPGPSSRLSAGNGITVPAIGAYGCTRMQGA